MSFNTSDISAEGIKSKDIFESGAKEAVDIYKKDFKAHKKEFNEAWLKHSAAIDRFNRKWGFLRSRERAAELNEQTKELVDYAETFNDPSDIERQNQTWLRETIKLIEEEGGAYAGDLKTLAIEGYMAASAQGIRIAEEKVRQKASLRLDAYDAQFVEAIKNNDIGEALSVQQEREAMLNSLVTEGIYTEQEGKAYLKNSKQQYADTILAKSLEHNHLIEVLENRSAALKNMKQNDEMFKPFFNRASDKPKTLFKRRLKALENKDVDLEYAQFEYTDSLNSWMVGAATANEVLLESKEYLSSLSKAKGVVKPEAIPKIDREIEKTKITMKLVEDIGLTGASLANGKQLDSPLLDASKSVDDIMKHYGFKSNTPAAGLISELRRRLPFIADDPVLSRVKLYEFATNSAGLDKELNDVGTADSLRTRMIQEKAVDRLMGGKGSMSALSATVFNNYLKDPSQQDSVNQMIVENPNLLYETEKHRSKDATALTTTTITEFAQKYNSILNINATDLLGIHVKLSENNDAQRVNDMIFKYIESIYNKDDRLTQFAETENIGRQQLFMILSAATYATMFKGLASTGDADKLLATTMRRDIKLTDVPEHVKFFVDALTKQQQRRGIVNTSDSSELQKFNTKSNIIISAFSEGDFGVGNYFRNLLPDIGERNIRPLEQVEYNELSKYVESLLGDKKIKLPKGRLRLMVHAGPVYKLAYVNGYGATMPLRDADNEYILFDTETIDWASEAYINESDRPAEFLINIIRISNDRL